MRKRLHWSCYVAAIALVPTPLFLAGCDQWMARTGLGTMTFDLPACRKFESANWKGDNAALWYTTRPMRPTERAETHTYESSTLFGVFEGKVVFVEHDCQNVTDVPEGGY